MGRGTRERQVARVGQLLRQLQVGAREAVVVAQGQGAGEEAGLVFETNKEQQDEYRYIKQIWLAEHHARTRGFQKAQIGSK